MNKRIKQLLSLSALLLIPLVSFAADQGGTLDFTPPASDVSVKLLGYIFGIVDGVLHGTGSQIMGQLFSVFNSAVLFLAGIMFAWVFGKGVVDTAHEGEFLGRQKNTLMLPLRVATGTALLLPKATGYCTLQVMIMWLVVQGAGVADQVWDKALDYLADGGQIVALNLDTKNTPNFQSKVDVAGKLLQSQVCMVGLQDFMQKNIDQNRSFLQDNQLPLPVPSFTGTVDFINQTLDKNSITVSLPNFPDSSPYQAFNGVCGTLTIQPYSTGIAASGNNTSAFDNDSELLKQANTARLVATQQMYLDMMPLAREIVTNVYQHLSEPKQTQPIGYKDSNNQWVSGNANKTALTTGFELYTSAEDYYGIIRPNLRLLTNDGGAIRKAAQEFVGQAKELGWIVSGGYYFKMAQLSQMGQSLGQESKDSVKVTAVDLNKKTQAIADFASDNNTKPELILGNVAMDGKTINLNNKLTQLLGPENKQVDTGYKLNKYIASATGFWNKATSGPATKFNITPMAEPSMPASPGFNLHCGGNWISRPICYAIGGMFGGLINSILTITHTSVDMVFTKIFSAMAQPGVEFLKYLSHNVGIGQGDPILALSKLGNTFITVTTEAWLALTFVGISMSVLNTAGLALAVFLMPLLGPIMMAFMVTGIMFSYYLPLLPYMLFVFGGVAWFIAVIEAMVAGPLVAFGLMYPESGSHETWGKSEPAIMLLLNVFFRPAMMVIGFITGIILSYVGLWLLNFTFGWTANNIFALQKSGITQIFASVFMVVIYLSMTLTIVNKAFSLIHILPDKVLRFLSGFNAEQLGQETAGMAQEAKGAITSGAQRVASAGGQAASNYQQFLQNQRQQSKEGPKAEPKDEPKNDPKAGSASLSVGPDKGT